MPDVTGVGIARGNKSLLAKGRRGTSTRGGKCAVKGVRVITETPPWKRKVHERREKGILAMSKDEVTRGLAQDIYLHQTYRKKRVWLEMMGDAKGMQNQSVRLMGVRLVSPRLKGGGGKLGKRHGHK